MRVDVRDRTSVETMAEKTVETYGRLDYAENAAGIVGQSQPLLTYPEDVFQNVLSVNVNGVFYCMQAEKNQMMKGGGSIVNLASAAGLRGFPTRVVYCAS